MREPGDDGAVACRGGCGTVVDLSPEARQLLEVLNRAIDARVGGGEHLEPEDVALCPRCQESKHEREEQLVRAKKTPPAPARSGRELF